MSVLVNWEKVNELCNEVGQEDFDEVVELFLEEVEETLGHVGQEGRLSMSPASPRSSPKPMTYEDTVR